MGRMTPQGRTRVRLLLLIVGSATLLLAVATAAHAGGSPWVVQIAIYEVGVGAAAILYALRIGSVHSSTTGRGWSVPELAPWMVLSALLLIGALYGLAHWSEILGRYEALGTRGSRRGLAQLLGGFFWGGVIGSAAIVQQVRSRSGRQSMIGPDRRRKVARKEKPGMDPHEDSTVTATGGTGVPPHTHAGDADGSGRVVLADVGYWTFRTKALLWGAAVFLGLIGVVFVGGIASSPSYALAAGALIGIAGGLALLAARMTFRSARSWSPWWAVVWLVVSVGIGGGVALVT